MSELAAVMLRSKEKMTIVAKDDVIQIERLELGSFGTNAYIVICQKTRDSVLIDAPAESNTIMDS